MKDKIKIIIIIILVIYSVSLTYLFVYSNYLEKKSNEILLEKIDRNYYGDNIVLKDYSSTKLKLTEEGKEIIHSMRSLHKVYNLIGSEHRDKEICAGYIWELSKKLWGSESPYHIGMLNQKTKTPSSAWELPYYYSYFGGNIIIDFSKYFSLKEKNYWEEINVDKLKRFFGIAFSEEAYFGDIGFLYNNTQYYNSLNGWYSNSHITKNIGVSDFKFILKENLVENNSNIFLNNLGCDEDTFLKVNHLLENYKIFLNGDQIVLVDDYFYYINNENELLEKVIFKYLDEISYKDITLTHFFSGQSRVDGLFKFTCEGEFLPINIISINPRLIEKM